VAGLAAAVKLSAVVAIYLQNNTTVTSKWLPVLSFALVFITVVFMVHLGGKLIQKTFEMAFLGWANRIGGILLYVALYAIIFSICLFYLEKINIFEKTTIETSHVFPYIAPLGPKVIDGIGKMIPLFKDTFIQLEGFFGGIATKIQQ
jgi:membrane protein required for colicin V production